MWSEHPMFRALALLLLLAACVPAAETAKPLASPKELRVETVRYSHSVRFAAGSATLSAAERVRLAEFLDAADLPSGERVTALSAGDGALAARRRGEIAAELARRGLALASPSTAAGTVLDRMSLGDEIVLLAERHVVMLPACPDWSKPAGVDYGNTVASNFGCTTATNLGLMVADPRDLLLGRDPGPGNIDRQVLIERKFRENVTQSTWCDKGSCGDGPKLRAATGSASAAGAKAAAEKKE
jgi:pilus assembly protein CpaD